MYFLLSATIDVLAFITPFVFAVLQFRLCKKSIQWRIKLIPIWILAAWAVMNVAASQMKAYGMILYIAYISSVLWIFNAAGAALGLVCYGIYRLIGRFRQS